MTTLLEYTRTQFPNHTVEVWTSDGWMTSILPDDQPTPHPSGSERHDDTSAVPLEEHTVVAHVIGGDAALTVLQRMHDAGWERTAAMLVRPIEPTVVAHGQENSESVTDLPDRRIVVAGAFGAVIGAIATAALGWLIADEFATVAVAAGMGAFFGAVIGVMLGGLGRYAGEQAWSQPHAPGRTMGVVAVFISDEESLVEAVRELEVATPDVIRIVNASGAWRAPIA